MIQVGIDVGAKFIKVLVLKDGNIVAKDQTPSGFAGKENAVKLFDRVLQQTGISQDEVDSITSTGSGRKVVDFATKSALKGMMVPGTIAILAPLVIGIIFGPVTLAGFLIGAIIAGIIIGIQYANSGGGMDNAKKYIEEGNFGGKGSPTHAAAVVGDTVGDPLKDTVGPSINILIKLMAVISLVLAPLFS